jgi:hypothetical protein
MPKITANDSSFINWRGLLCGEWQILLFCHDAVFGHDTVKIIQLFSQAVNLPGRTFNRHDNQAGAIADATALDINAQPRHDQMALIGQQLLDFLGVRLPVFYQNGNGG